MSSGNPLRFVSYLVLERLARAAVSAIALALMARHLEPAGFGALNFALSLAGTIMPLAQLGLEAVVVRELVRRPEQAGELLGTTAILRAATGVVCAGGLLLAGFSVDALAGARAALGPVSLLLVLQALETADLWFRAEVRSGPTVIVRSIAVFGSSLVKIALALHGASVGAFAWVAAAEVLVFGVGLIAFFRSENHGRITWRWDGRLAARLVRESWIFGAAGALGGLAFRLDQMAVATWLGDAAAGVYFAVLRLVEIPTFVAASFGTALFPQLAHGTREELAARLRASCGVMAAVAWLTALVTSATAPWMMRTVFGEAYAAAWPVLVLRAWSTLPYFCGIVRANYLAAIGAPRGQMISVAVTAALQSVALAVLLPRLGLAGAAAAFLFTELANAWLVPVLVPALRPCLVPQWQGWGLPWTAAGRRELLAFLREQRQRQPTTEPKLEA